MTSVPNSINKKMKTPIALILFAIGFLKVSANPEEKVATPPVAAVVQANALPGSWARGFILPNGAPEVLEVVTIGDDGALRVVMVEMMLMEVGSEGSSSKLVFQDERAVDLESGKEQGSDVIWSVVDGRLHCDGGMPDDLNYRTIFSRLEAISN